MSTTYSIPPSAHDSRGRHGRHKRSGHWSSKQAQPGMSEMGSQDLREPPHLNPEISMRSNGYAPATNHAHQPSYSPMHIPPPSADDLLGESWVKTRAKGEGV